MRVSDQGAFFTVSYSRQDLEAFKRKWPAFHGSGAGSFTFEKSNGDLVDATGSAVKYGETDGWSAFADDCKKYGKGKLGIPLSGFSNPKLFSTSCRTGVINPCTGAALLVGLVVGKKVL